MLSRTPTTARPFRFQQPSKGTFRRMLFSMVDWPLATMVGLSSLNHIYALSKALLEEDRRGLEAGRRPGPVGSLANAHFVDYCLHTLGIGIDVSERDAERIPRAGPAVVVANHPFGMLEGMILVALLRRARPDVKVLANDMLACMPEMHDVMFFVNPFETREARRQNMAAVRSAIQWVRDGHLLAIFPAGEVSALHLRQRAVVDRPWVDTCARITRMCSSPALPIYFAGRNGNVFQLAGLIHPFLRTAMLPHELLKKRRSSVSLRVGNLIPFDRLSRLADDRALTNYLRLRTYLLATRAPERSAAALKPGPSGPDSDLPPDPTHPAAIAAAASAAGLRPLSRNARNPAALLPEPEPVIDPVPPSQLAAEVARLPAEQTLAHSADLAVIYARARQVPGVLREIGRLRELTFRANNEGTGKAIDLDRFDRYYVHLFVWNVRKSEVVGAYRIGRADRIVRRLGVQGLYTSTLFYYQKRLLDQINPALELGRSFVRQEYQRSYSPLLLLWKGIGLYVCRHPRYKTLFGPVSINNEYESTSRQLIASFLTAHRFAHELGKMLRPRNPLTLVNAGAGAYEIRSGSAVVSDIEQVNELLAEIESDQKGVPILVRQYLKLGAQLLGFNVDPDFGDVLDGLMVVDLSRTDRRVLDKYMGKEQAGKFLACHGRA